MNNRKAFGGFIGGAFKMFVGNCSEPLLTAGRSQRSQQKQLSKLHKR